LLHEEHVHQTQTNDGIFRGIKSLERDPALRPLICQYPANQRDYVRRAYLKLGPMQPLLKNYKVYGTGNQKCRFQYNWFNIFLAWLEYLESSQRCILFILISTQHNTKATEVVPMSSQYMDLQSGRRSMMEGGVHS
jgi:hypothetical protein